MAINNETSGTVFIDADELTHKRITDKTEFTAETITMECVGTGGSLDPYIPDVYNMTHDDYLLLRTAMKNPRDKAILDILCTARHNDGSVIGYEEICNMRIKDAVLSGAYKRTAVGLVVFAPCFYMLKTVRGRSSKVDWVILSNWIGLYDYIESLGLPMDKTLYENDKLLFVTITPGGWTAGNPMSSRAIVDILHNAGVRCGLV